MVADPIRVGFSITVVRRYVRPCRQGRRQNRECTRASTKPKRKSAHVTFFVYCAALTNVMARNATLSVASARSR